MIKVGYVRLADEVPLHDNKGNELGFKPVPLHSPLVQLLTLAQRATHAFAYVLPSDPHTGLYSFVQIQAPTPQNKLQVVLISPLFIFTIHQLTCEL